MEHKKAVRLSNLAYFEVEVHLEIHQLDSSLDP